MNEEAVKALYESLSENYEVGTIDEFKVYLLDETKRGKFFEEVISPEYDVESIDQFESTYGLKKKDFSTLGTGGTDGTSTEMGGLTSLDSSDQTIDLSILSIGDDADFAAAPIREGVLINKDGKESTHIMAAEQLEDGTWVGFPTLFQNEDKTWVDMSKQAKEDWMPVYEEAKSRGEVKEFGQDSKSAIAYGEGSWKESYNKNKKILGDGFDPSTLTAPLENGEIPDPVNTEAKVLSELGIEPIEFKTWKEKNLREESKSYKFFKNILLNDEGEQFEDEQSIQKQITAFLAQKLNKNLALIDEADEEEKQILIDQNRKDAQIIVDNLKAYEKESITDDQESRRKLLERQRSGGVRMAVTTGFEMIKAGANAAANFSMGTAAALFTEADALLNATGADKKGALLGISEMFLDSAEHWSLDAGETQRSTFVQGKEVMSNGKAYIVAENGVIYDEETHIRVDDLLSKEEVESIEKKAEAIEGDSTSFDMGSGLTALTSTVVNLFGLIIGGKKLQKILGVSPKLGMGIMSFSSTVASNVESVKEDLMAQGVSEKEATNKALVFGNAIATLDGIFSALAGSNEKLLGSTKVVKDLLLDLVKKKGSGFTTQQLKRKAADLIKENASELFIEEIPVLLSERAINNAINLSVGMDIRAGIEDLNRADYMETAFLTVGATTSLGSKRLLTSNQRNDVIRYLSKNITDVDKTSVKLVADGLLTQKEADKAVAEIKAMQYAERKVSGAVKTTENMVEAAALIEKKEKLNTERDNTDPSLRGDIDKRIASIDQQLEQLKEKDNQDVQDIIDGEKDGEINIEVTRAEAVAALKAENEANERLGLPTIIESESNILKTQDKLMKEKQAETETQKDESEQVVPETEVNPNQKYEDAVANIDQQISDLRTEDGSILPKDMKKFKALQAKRVKAKFDADRGDSDGSMSIRVEGADGGVLVGEEAIQAENDIENYIATIEKNVTSGKITKEKGRDMIMRYVGAQGKYNFLLNEIDSMNRYVRDRLDSSIPEVGNNKSKFTDWRKGNKTGAQTQKDESEQVVPETEEKSKTYAEELKKTKDSDPENYWSVDTVTEEEAGKGTVIDTEDGAAVVSADGDIKGVFKKLTSKAKGVAQVLLKKAVEAGGTKLDNFVTGAKGVKLQEIYEKAGFRVVSRTPFDENFKPKGWTEKDGRPDVVSMVYDPDNKLDFEEKTFDNYDDMISYRDGILEGNIASNLSQEFKSGKPSMEEVYNKAEDLGIPLKEAREYLEEIGYTEKEIKDFVIKREDMSVKRDVAGEKNIFAKGKNVALNFLDTIKRKLSSAKSYMPKNAFIAKETKNAHIQAEIKVAERIAKRLNNMLKGQPDSVYDEVNKLMRGEKADLPKKIALIATSMRNHIDSLSEKLVMSGAVESEGAAANIMNNIGTYMNRSYRLFDDKNYADNISEEVILEAKEFLKAQELNRIIKESAKENITPQEYVKKQKGGKNFTVEQYIDAKADQSVRRIIKKDEADAFVSAVSNEAKKDTKIFKERKEIPAEIRALMGEYTDAAYNYVMSVGKVKAIIETQKYLDKLKDIGDGVFLFEEGDPRIPAGYTKIASETNQALAPLNGYYAPKELVEQMTSGPINITGSKFWQNAFEVYMKGIGSVKYTKTILSVGTHAKNVLGNAYFMAQNGYFNPKDYNEAFKVLKNEFKNLDNEQLNKKLDEYIKAGIINQGVSLREVQGLLEGDQDFDVKIEQRTAKKSENKIKKAAKNLGKNLEELYQAEDDLFKIVSYENEKRDYAKIEFDKKYEELSEKEKAKIDSKVSEIVKNILPNYSRLGNISKLLRVAPVATFISFQLEAYRTAFNTTDLALKEVKSKNPRERKKGSKRLASLIGFQALKYSALSALGNALLGDDDDDEEEGKVQETIEGALGISKPSTGVMDARPFLPFWSKNSDILITKAGDGEFSYIDMTASDPYGGLSKVVRAFQRGETIEQGILSAAKELISPIISTDILSGTIASLARNEDVYGKKIWEKTDSPDEKAIKIIDAIYKTLEPGTLTSLRKVAGADTPGKVYTNYGKYVTKIMNKENRVAEAIGQLTGFKKNDVNVEMQMNYKLGDLKEDMKPIEIKKYIAKKNIETTGDAREYIELIKNEYPDKYEIYKEASEIVKSAQKFGLSIDKIYPILKSKFPKGDDADIIFLFDQIIDQLIPKDE